MFQERIINIRLIFSHLRKKYLFGCLSLCFLSFAFHGNLLAQENLIFDHITVSQGLTQSLVSTMLRDSRDFMWFGTLNGINRYDGVKIKQFESIPFDSTTISNGNVRVIYEDHDSCLWVGTIDGLNRFDYKKESFSRIMHDPINQTSLLDNFIVAIAEDTQKNLWVVTSRGLNKYDHNRSNFSHVLIPYSGDSGQPQIEAAFMTDPGTIYLYAGNRVYIFHTSDSSFSIAVNDIKPGQVNALFVTEAHDIWIASEYDGAYLVDSKGVITHFYPESPVKSGINSISVKSIDADRKHNLWLSTRNGLHLYNPKTKTFTVYLNVYGNPTSLLSSYARCLYEDPQGIIWVSTVGGLNKFNPARLRFKHFKTNGRPGETGLGVFFTDDNLIWSFYRDNNDVLWVGSMRNNLSYIKFSDLNKGNFTTAEFYRNGNKITPPFNSVFDIDGDRKNNLWLSTDNGLYYFNTATHELTGYRHQEGNPNSLADNLIGAIDLYQDSIIWVGTDNGISRFNFVKNRYTNYYHDSNDSTTIVDNYIYNLNIENNNRLWVVAEGGISYANLKNVKDPKQLRFKTRVMNDQQGKVVFNDIIPSKKDPGKLYWVCTDNGFLSVDSSLNIINSYSVEDGLPNKLVYEIIEDSKGQLWLSTDNGISCFDPATKIFRNFTTSDGLQANEFNSNASYCDKDGYFYFGGINGFNIFHPDSLVISDFSPRIVITGMEVLHKPVIINGQAPEGFKIPESITETRRIRLKYKQNFFSFEFAALDYSDPEKIHYEYTLEGFDQGWISCKGSPIAHYTNVRPGRYVFRVKATNSDGIWSKHSAQLEIIVTPPFWKTPLFIFAFVLLIALAVYILYRIRVKTLERDKRTLEEEVQKRTLEINEINHDLKKSNSFIESVINNATYGITVITREGKIILANPAAANLTGYSQSELLTMNYKDFTPERWHNYDEEVLKELEKGKSAYHEKEYRKKDGTVIQVAISNSFIKNYDIPAIVNIINDITERIANEKELLEHRTNLEKLVKQRTADLIAAKESAEKADRLKTAFLSNISHEIRTPMNAIMGFSNLLMTENNDQEQLNEYLEFITSAAQSLLSIVTNIVEISKISAGDITLGSDNFNFNKLIDDIYLQYYSQVQAKGLDFILEYKSPGKETMICADKSKIQTTIGHLLDNAIKFTSKGFIKLKYHVFPDHIEVCVQDTGIGVHKDHQIEIFEPFKQADTTLSRGYGGTGLGLAISKAYIEKMKGKIWFESVHEEGSSFYFSFPYEKRGDKAEEPVKFTDKPKGLNILIVEDEEMNYYYLAQVLKAKSKNIYYARDGYSAIEICKNNPGINIVLMDIKLPGMDGLEATAEIKKIRPDLPIIAQTAYTLIGDREKALEAGCNDYISKPIDMDRLYTIIKNYIAI